jgi:fructose-bisphosphate aldolase class II
MYDWVREHAAGDRRSQDTDQQFIYKARKKAIGAFKRELWALDAGARQAIGAALQDRFTCLMRRLNVAGSAGLVSTYVQTSPAAADREAEIKAAQC